MNGSVTCSRSAVSSDTETVSHRLANSAFRSALTCGVQSVCLGKGSTARSAGASGSPPRKATT